MTIKVILLLFVAGFGHTEHFGEALKILGLFPLPAMSHFHVFEPLMRGLAKAGHDVTVFSMFPQKQPLANYTDIVIPGELLTAAISLQGDWFLMRRKIGKFYDHSILYNWSVTSCDNSYNSTELQNILRLKTHFDVIIMEQFNTDCLIGVPWHLKTPVIAMSSCALMPWHYNRIGTPLLPSHIPNMFASSSEKMTLKKRLTNFVDIYVWRFIYSMFMDADADAKLKQVFGEGVPPVSELVNMNSLTFVNQHYSMVGARPLSQSFIEIGGIHIKKPTALSSDIKKYLDDAVEGVIFVSWGSMVRAASMPDEKRQHLVDAFASLKQRVLWKWENETLVNQPKNVKISKWFQQRDILCHPNVKVFVSHGGLLGSTETVHCGVAAVFTPLYGDQFHNAASMVNRRMAAIVHYEDITKDTMLKAIHTVLQPEYQENAKTVAYSFNNRIKSPLETAIWWVEHVGKTGGAPLTQSYAVFMSGFVYHSLDVIGILIGIVVVILGGCWWVIRRCFVVRNISANTKTSKPKGQ